MRLNLSLLAVALSGCVSATSLAPRDDVAGSRVIYESGLGWQIIPDGNCSAAIAPVEELIGDERNPVFLVFLKNTSNEEFLFRPEQISVHSSGREFTALGQRDLNYLALQRRNSEQLAATLTGALWGISTALSGSMRASSSYAVSGPGGAITGISNTSFSDPGAATRGALVGAGIAAQGSATAQAEYRYAVAASRAFVATNTLLPGTYYGGLFEVAKYRRKQKRDTIEIDLTSCGERKAFVFYASKAAPPAGLNDGPSKAQGGGW